MNDDDKLECITNGEFIHEREIYCPYCGDEYEIDEKYELYADGEEEVYCANCAKRFTVITNVINFYSTRKGEAQ